MAQTFWNFGMWHSWNVWMKWRMKKYQYCLAILRLCPNWVWHQRPKTGQRHQEGCILLSCQTLDFFCLTASRKSAMPHQRAYPLACSLSTIFFLSSDASSCSVRLHKRLCNFSAILECSERSKACFLRVSWYKIQIVWHSGATKKCPRHFGAIGVVIMVFSTFSFAQPKQITSQ